MSFVMLCHAADWCSDSAMLCQGSAPSRPDIARHLAALGLVPRELHMNG